MFKQANANGSDMRFSEEGRPLAYRVEQWDSAKGSACVWARAPAIRGNTRQTLTLHWGRADATSESYGKSVFNASKGHAVVMHLGDAEGRR
jgi:hypothetical protein